MLLLSAKELPLKKHQTIILSIPTTATTQYLLYDGHGSTRQLIADDGTTVTASYSYDAYGMMLGGNPSSAPSTNLLYAGEYFDTGLQQYYNRARWYDPSNGTFNRTDPFAGNMVDPQSLHKYTYTHNNPVNGIDPSGGSIILLIAIAVLMTFALLTIVDTTSYHGDARKYRPYDLKQACDYDETECAAVDQDYNDGAKKDCEAEAVEVAMYYENWLRNYWRSSAPWYTPCNVYQFKIWSAMTSKEFKFFYFESGTNPFGTGENMDHMNFVGIFHKCNRRKKTRADGLYTLVPGDTSDAILFPWHRGAPRKIYNRGLGNPYVQPGTTSELGWQ